MKIKVINPDLARTLDVPASGIVDVKCRRGVPVNREWRNRVKDAKLDGCVKVQGVRKPKALTLKSDDKSLKKEPK